MATQVQEVLAQTTVVPKAPRSRLPMTTAEAGRRAPRAWVCPLVKTHCSRITAAPCSEVCSSCAVYQTWHLADHVDPRFWH